MLIKIEAVNIDSFVGGAQNLSAIRGGGLILLDMPEEIRQRLTTAFGEPDVLTQGASKAVFRVKGADCGDVDKAVRQWLREGEYAHATIAVATAPDGDNSFFDADEALTGAIRREQMHSFSLAALSMESGRHVCEMDHVRPGTKPVDAKGKEMWVSPVSEAKFEYGKAEKQNFFTKHGDAPKEWRYTRWMEELATWDRAGNLNHKVAVFYADGNELRKKLQDAVSGLEKDQQEQTIREFDLHFQAKRKEFLKRILSQIGEKRWLTADDRWRIEVLLWGGDELMVVVPAWCGWEVAELFCETMRKADFVPTHGAKVQVKHGMGLLFAHEKAPIHALTKLIHELADESKDAGRELDRLSYLVLESFDHVGESLEEFRKSRCPVSVVLEAEGTALKDMATALQKLRDDEFPRRKAFQAAMGLADGKGTKWLQENVDRFVNVKRWETGLTAWKKLTGNDSAAWYHMAELWDYAGVTL